MTLTKEDLLVIADVLEMRAHGDGERELAAKVRGAAGAMPVATGMLPELDDYDWREAFGYAGEPGTNAGGARVSIALGSACSDAPFTRADVVEVRHARAGENDGPAWLACGRLRDGRWFFLEASCDFTGWDCQAGGSAVVADSWEALLAYGLTDEAREVWGLHPTGERKP